MTFCTNCGHAVPDGVKFCSNCGAAINSNNSVANNGVTTPDFTINNESYEPHTMGNSLQNVLQKNWIDKFSKFFGIILMIIAFVDFQSDPPAFTIVLSIAIIAGAIFCLSQKYKLKGFTIIALILAIICLIAGINQGKRMGFFKLPGASGYNKSSVETTIDETPVAEKEAQKEVISNDPKEKNEAKSENRVDPDLKAFLDSYEKFVDEYVVFMKKYMADPSNAISMLSEYTKIMEKYEDFAEKVDKYDSNSMSTADAKYYLEVTNRCTQKMLEIYY